MIPHTQLRAHIDGEQNGDCWATGIECILDLPLGTLPRWEVGQDWGSYWYSVQAYLFHHHRLLVSEVPGHQWPAVRVEGWHLITGQSPRKPDDPTFRHSVVGRDGEYVHDPHPDRTGVLDHQSWDVITPLPAGWETWWHPASLPCPCGCTPAAEEQQAA